MAHLTIKLAVSAAVMALMSAAPGNIGAQGVAPGPYEILPFEDAFIVEAFCDLLPASSARADWTGWSGSTWVSPNAYNNHGGSDYSLPTGTPLYASTTGTVVALVNDQPENNHSTEYGNYVKIAADGLSPRGQQITVLTAHMLDVSVTVGQDVNAGDLIGHSDNTGNSTSEHCHVQSALAAGDVFTCPFYHAHNKYPIMLNPSGTVQVGHVVKVKVGSTPIRADMFANSSVVTTAHENQLYFAAFAKRGFYRVFIPNESGTRSAWIRALDVEEVFSGTVVQPLPDAGAYNHSTQLAAPYAIRNDTESVIGQIYYGGGRFVADQTAPGGKYRIALPGPTPTWGWVQADSNMVVYPELYNPEVNLAARPSNEFPIENDFDTVGPVYWGRAKFDRQVVKAFSPAAPGGDGKALFVTDATNTGNGAYETVIFGRPEHRDYFVEADVYFRHNPDYTGDSNPDTWERYGIFLRDDGFGGFDQTFEGAGNCYAMTWDSDDGRLRCCKILNASISDYAPSDIYMPVSGWHKMRIEAEGTTIRFYLDGVLRATATDATSTAHISGQCGVGYHSTIAGYPVARGAYFDNFRADVLPGSTVNDWAIY